MFYSKSKKIIFIHIPKTGGWTFINHLLLNIFDGISNSFYFHADIKKIESYLKIDHISYTWFTFVRNPYDRIYSGYNFCFKNNIIQKNISFKDFLINIFNGMYIDFVWIKPISNFITSYDFKKYNIQFYKYENYNYNINIICNQLNITNNIIQNYHVTNNQLTNLTFKYKYQYDNDISLYNLVNIFYHSDFEAFGYTKLYM